MCVYIKVCVCVYMRKTNIYIYIYIHMFVYVYINNIYIYIYRYIERYMRRARLRGVAGSAVSLGDFLVCSFVFFLFSSLSLNLWRILGGTTCLTLRV